MFTEKDQLSFQTKEWKAIPRIARVVPFGYRVDDDNPDLLQPIILELEALEKAKVHLRQFSYREVANWLTKVTGRYISHMGLQKRVKNEQRRRSKARTFELWARRAEEARRKAEKLTQTTLGAGEDLTSQDGTNS